MQGTCSRRGPGEPVRTLRNGFPKLIMQTWKSERIPDKWAPGQHSVQRAFADWTYVLLTDADCHEFVDTYFPEHKEAFVALPYAIQRADVIRYMWLYVHGGLYMDLDYLVQKPFAHLFEDLTSPLYVLHSSHVPYILTNSLIGVLPKQGFLKTLIAKALYISKSVIYGKHLRVMFTTGPMAFHGAITESKSTYTVLPTDLFLKTSPESYTIPLEGQSWNALDSFVLNTLMTYKKEVASLLGLFLLYILRGFLQYKERVQVLRNLLLKKRK